MRGGACLTDCQGGGREPHVIVMGGIGEQKSNNGTQFFQQDRIYDGQECATAVSGNLLGGANKYGMPVGFDCTIEGGYGNRHGADDSRTMLQGTEYKLSPDDRRDVWLVDKTRNGQEREVANNISAREDRGVSERNMEGTAVVLKIRGGLPKMYDDYNGRMREDEVSCTLTPNTGSSTERNGQKVVLPVLTPDRTEKRQNGRRFKENGDPAFTLTSEDRCGVALSVLGGIYRNQSAGYQRGIEEGIARTLKADTRPQGVGITVRNIKEKKKVGIPMAQETNTTKDHPGMYVELSNGAIVYAVWYPKYECYVAIRKLTPRECFRLQGWTDDYFEKAELVNSDSQLYKQAGNGVTVNVVEVIGKRLREIEDGR